MIQRSADVVILGGGSGGYPAAIRASELGLSVILVESDKLGGTCLHRGCIPTKALLHAAEVADSACGAAQFGVSVGFDGIDISGVHQYKDSVVSRLYQGLQGLIAGHGVEVVSGRGSFVGPRFVEVDGETIAGEHVILATGSQSKSLPGLEIGGRVLTSDQALTLDYVPDDAIVLGGGVIGVEFASVWASFGAKITILEALDRLVPNEDEFASTQLTRALRRRKITSKTGVRFAGVEQDGEAVFVSLESGDTLEAEVLLVAVGRGPNTAGCGFDEAGIEMDHGYVGTDDRLRTNLPNVYAVGDIVPGLQLAHRGFQQGIFVAEEIAGRNPSAIDESGIPRITYCDPNVASVGLTEAAAKEVHGEIETYIYDLGGNGKSQILKTAGGIKVVRVKDGPIVGVHMVGARIGELIGEAQLIVGWEAYPEAAAPMVHGHPSQYEAMGEAMLAMAGKPLHVHD